MAPAVYRLPPVRFTPGGAASEGDPRPEWSAEPALRTLAEARDILGNAIDSYRGLLSLVVAIRL